MCRRCQAGSKVQSGQAHFMTQVQGTAFTPQTLHVLVLNLLARCSSLNSSLSSLMTILCSVYCYVNILVGGCKSLISNKNIQTVSNLFFLYYELKKAKIISARSVLL